MKGLPTHSTYNHTLNDSRIHSWNVRTKNSNGSNKVIEEYYLNEEMAAPNVGKPRNAVLRKAFGRHTAVTASSLYSCRKILQREICQVHPNFRMVNEQNTSSAQVHDVSSLTHFTDLTSFKQKHLLAGQSGMVGLLIARLLRVKEQGICHIWTNKQASEMIARYSHSEFSTEILVGNRYLYRLPQLISCDYSDKYVVGSTSNGCKETIPLDCNTPEKIKETHSLLLDLYRRHIDSLCSAVNLFKVGKVSLDEIRTNPEFVQLLSVFWRYNNQLMAIQSNILPSDYQCELKRIFAVSDICSISAQVPRLISYDIAHIFDNPRQSFAIFLKTTKETFIRLSNDGLTSAFLTFAAIEPKMISNDFNPTHSTKYVGFDLVCHANHIPSKHVTFGSLRIQYARHIPIWKNTNKRAIYRSIDQYQPKYYPVQVQIDDIRAGRCQTKKSMRVNKR
jgi:hypothetical protein